MLFTSHPWPDRRVGRRRSPRLVALLALVTAACGDGGSGQGGQAGAGDGARGGTLAIATVGDPEAILPPLVETLPGAQVADQLFERLADPRDSLVTIGDAGFRPRLAERWRWAPDSLSIAFTLDPRARWHDGRPVTANDVRFSLALYRDPAVGSPVAPLLANVDSVSVRDPRTAVVWFRRRTPEQFYDVVYQMHVLPAHRLDTVPAARLRESPAAREVVGSGPFRLGRRVSGQLLEVTAVADAWQGRPALDRVLWLVHADPMAATARLLAGEADLWEGLRGPAVAEVARDTALRLLPYPSLDVGFLAFNQRDPAARARPHPLLGDRALRRALAMAVDRTTAVRAVFDTLAWPSAAPVPRAVVGWTAAPLGPAHDPAGARAALDALGWRATGPEGTRTRDGRPLAFRLLVPSSSATRLQLAQLLQQQLRAVGARVELEPVDPARFGAALGDGSFDAVLHVWHSDPSPTAILQLWGAPGAAGRGTSNATGYRSAAFEALVDSAARTFDRARATTLYARADSLLAEDVPAVFLYESRQVAGMHRRLRPTGLRADAWWANLAAWRVAPGEAIARDRLGAPQR